MVVENAVIDKLVQVIHKKEVIGSEEEPIYVKQGDII